MPDDLEQSLRTLPQHGRLLHHDAHLAVWQFEHAGRGYRLYHFARAGLIGRLLVRRPSAWALFHGLQSLQKAGIPVLRPVAMLSGFRSDEPTGIRRADAVIIEYPPSAIALDQYLLDLEQAAAPVPDRRRLEMQLAALLYHCDKAHLGLRYPTLGSFVLLDDQLLIADGMHVRRRSLGRNGLRRDDLLYLAHSARRFATRTELLRTWQFFCPGTPLPPLRNRVANMLDRARSRAALFENDRFGTIRIGNWHGIFTKKTDDLRRYAPASKVNLSAADWAQAWPAIWEQVQSGKLSALKRGDNGDVWLTDATIGSANLQLVIKRPRRKYFRQYLTDIFRGSRARRIWIKSFKALSRDLPVEMPLLLMEQRTAGYVRDAVVVLGFIPGPTLATVNLDALPIEMRDNLMRRTGAILRRVDSLGFTHTDAKSTNWIAYEDPVLGPTPVMIDADALRHYRWSLLGLHRLLKAMRQHPQYTPADSKALCQGYAPASPLVSDQAV